MDLGKRVIVFLTARGLPDVASPTPGAFRSGVTSANSPLQLLEDSSSSLDGLRFSARNDYKSAESIPHLTPNQRWVTFTATFSGTLQAYPVEMPKELWR